MNTQEIISNGEIKKVHGNANFGGMSKRAVVNLGILKCASGYYQGSTSRAIITEHNLINRNYELTLKGRQYLWAAFGDDKF